jgi:hypothetical protein
LLREAGIDGSDFGGSCGGIWGAREEDCGGQQARGCGVERMKEGRERSGVVKRVHTGRTILERGSAVTRKIAIESGGRKMIYRI